MNYSNSAWKESEFPEFVRSLPAADYSADGGEAIRGFIVQGEGHQVLYNEHDEPLEFTPHRHAASFGVVLSGECELVIDGVVHGPFGVGDVYHVPADTTHYARESANYRDIVIFNERARVDKA